MVLPPGDARASAGHTSGAHTHHHADPNPHPHADPHLHTDGHAYTHRHAHSLSDANTDACSDSRSPPSHTYARSYSDTTDGNAHLSADGGTAATPAHQSAAAALS